MILSGISPRVSPEYCLKLDYSIYFFQDSCKYYFMREVKGFFDSVSNRVLSMSKFATRGRGMLGW